MGNILVSFIVPVYNVQNYIAKTIQSIVDQSYSDIEIILVNDGSTDKSGEICKSLLNNDKRIRYIHQENKGVSVARNVGIQNAKGKWVCFVDGDDWVEPDLCKSLLPAIDKDIDICFFSYHKVMASSVENMETDVVKSEFCRQDFEKMQRAIFFMQGYEYTNVAAIWGKLFRKEFLEKNELKFLVNQKKSQDTLFMLHALQKAQNAVYVNKALYNYRIIKSSISRRYNSEIFDIYTKLLNEFYKFIIENNNTEEFFKAYQYRVFRNFMVAVTLDCCHIDNKFSYADRKSRFIEMYGKEPFKKAMNEVDINQFPIKERILAYLVKKRYFLFIDTLNKLRYMIRKMG